jgi:molecular chaperone GrpE
MPPANDPPGEAETAALAEEIARLDVEDGSVPPAEAAPNVLPIEPANEAVQRLEREASEWKDRAMRGAADFDNYRKRAIREREEAAARGQSEIAGKVIDVVDDLARVAHLDPASTTAQALHDGMLAIERKMMKMLETVGIERLGAAGEKFNPNEHEAVMSVPAPNAEADDTVAAVFQPGYRFKGTLLRPARVSVHQWGGNQ